MLTQRIVDLACNYGRYGYCEEPVFHHFLDFFPFLFYINDNDGVKQCMGKCLRFAFFAAFGPSDTTRKVEA